MFVPRLAAVAAVLSIAFLHSQAADETVPGPVNDLAEMSKAGTLFAKENYKTVRGHCVRLFEDRNQSAIRVAYAADADNINAWFAKNKEVKEEFYSAIDEKHDRI